ncbi:MAG: hypothetical protein GY832_45835 [Chloroflexi bacterium]|nr:hypothetical protein [Chloroflexota bacterium]
MKKQIAYPTLLFVLCILVLNSSALAQPGAQTDEDAKGTTIYPDAIVWNLGIVYSQATLTISGPGDLILGQEFPTGVTPRFDVQDQTYPDGSYNYELRFSPLLSPETQAALAAVAQSEQREQTIESLRQADELPEMPLISGHFTITDGAIVTGSGPKPDAEGAEATKDGRAPDQVISEDLYVIGSQCLGTQCTGTESFGYDTLRLKEDNLRIMFHDTSGTLSYPNNDWQIRVNEFFDGGQNAFYIDDLGPDADNGYTIQSTPFVIESGTPTNTLYLEENGRVGLGTSAPVVELHVVDADSPSVRLEQTNEHGWEPQTWDIVGNETNFYIRDVTNGSRLPFRIQPNAPNNSLCIRDGGNVGIGTWTPAAPLELETTGESATFIAERTDGATAIVSAMTDTVHLGSQSDDPVSLVVNDEPIVTIAANGQMTVGLGTTVTLILDASGNLVIAGALTEASDVALKEGFESVDAQTVLARILQLPITTWNYIADGSSVRHMGPMAQDFYAAFGLGADDTHIAPLDVNGVTLAGLQELTRLLQTQETQIEKLERENQELEQRLEVIEAQIDALLAAQE